MLSKRSAQTKYQMSNLQRLVQKYAIDEHVKEVMNCRTFFRNGIHKTFN